MENPNDKPTIAGRCAICRRPVLATDHYYRDWQKVAHVDCVERLAEDAAAYQMGAE